MDFNEMNRNLEGSNSRERRIRELMEKLLRRGLAMTKESARQLAESMLQTEERVQKTFQDRKENATMYNTPSRKDVPVVENAKGPGFMSPPKTLSQLQAEYDVKRVNMERMRENAISSKPVAVQTHYDTPENDKEWVHLSPEKSDDGAMTEEDTAITGQEVEPENGDAAPVESAAVESSPVESSPVDKPDATQPTGEESISEESEVSDPVIDDVVEEIPEPAESAVEDERPISEPSPEDVTVDAVTDEATPEDVAKEDVVEEEPATAPVMQLSAESLVDTSEDDVADLSEPEVYDSPDSDETETAVGSDVETYDETTEDAEEASHQPAEEEGDVPVAADQADPEPLEEAEPPREDLAKKHGVDLANMFNVNK